MKNLSIQNYYLSLLKLAILSQVFLFFHLGCKPKLRDHQVADMLEVKNKGSLITSEKRELIPVLNCNSKSIYSSFVGLSSGYPHDEFVFNISKGPVLTGNESCYINLYSSSFDNLELVDFKDKMISGDQYKLLYSSDVTSKKHTDYNFKFKKLYKTIVNNALLSKIAFEFDRPVEGLEYQLYCQETKIMKPTKKELNILEFEIYKFDVFSSSNYLTHCLLKNSETESLLKTSLPDALEIKAQISFKVLDELKTIKNQAIFSRLSGKQYSHIVNGCEYIYDFKLDGDLESYRYFMKANEGCEKQSSSSNTYNRLEIYSNHVLLPGLLSSEKILVKFFRENEPIFSILELVEGGFIKIGGQVSKIELLINLKTGLKFNEM